MSFQWLQMRITEEQDRRQKESDILARLPSVLEEVNAAITECVKTYTEAFGPQSMEAHLLPHKIRLTVKEHKNGKWEPSAKVEVTTVVRLPGLHIERNGEPLDIEVGLLPGEKTFYKDGDKFLTMEELTRRILDRALFPNLGD